MPINRQSAVAFSGHRGFKMTSDLGSGYNRFITQLQSSLDNTIRELCSLGYDTFLTGMAEGFDMLAAWRVLEFREQNPEAGVRLIAAVPYPAQAERYSPEDAAHYDLILSRANEVITICNTYHTGCFHMRNDFLIDNASELVCFFNGTSGGTRYTVDRARKKGLRVTNLCKEYRQETIEQTLF